MEVTIYSRGHSWCSLFSEEEKGKLTVAQLKFWLNAAVKVKKVILKKKLLERQVSGAE